MTETSQDLKAKKVDPEEHRKVQQHCEMVLAQGFVTLIYDLRELYKQVDKKEAQLEGMLVGEPVMLRRRRRTVPDATECRFCGETITKATKRPT